MQVILKNLVNVKDGYARNYLIPNSLAEIATKGALEQRERNIARIRAKAEKLHQEALVAKEEIEKIGVIALSAKAGESGKLFGTITTKKLSEELLAKCGIEIDKKSIILDSPINHIGNFVMTIKLSSKVKAQLNVEVTASETIKEVYEEEEVKEEAQEA